MKAKYYLYGTILGLCLIPAVAIYILSLNEFLLRLPDWQFALPFAVGYAAALAAGLAADRWIQRRGFFATIFVLVGVFLAGVFFGSLANLFFNGQVLNPSFGLGGEIFSWVFKPVFWFSIIGIPCAVVVGIMHYFAHRIYGRWRGAGSET